MACLAYVHPYNLAHTFLTNHEVAVRIASQGQVAQAQYAQLVGQLEKSVENAKGRPDANPMSQAVLDLKKELEKTRTLSESINSKYGVPLSWPSLDSVPQCADRLFNFDGNCQTEILGKKWIIPSVTTTFWLLFGGLLVGLGAPFWARAVSSLTASRDVTGKIADVILPDHRTSTAKNRSNQSNAESSLATTAFRVTRSAQGAK